MDLSSGDGKSKNIKSGDGSFDYLQKLIIIGDSGVGKSNILLRYASDQFFQNHMVTVGLNYVFKIQPFDDIIVKLQIWDTAGQDKFKTITKNYYRNSQGVLVVFALNCRDSFHAVQQWMDDLAQTTEERTCILLLGNKSDRDSDREISSDEALHLAKTYGVEYMECSAKNGENIDEAFQKIGKAMKKTFIDGCEGVKGNVKEDKIKIRSHPWHKKCCQH